MPESCFMYTEGQTVIALQPNAPGVHQKIGIIEKVNRDPASNFPYHVIYGNGITSIHEQSEITPLAWYLMVREEETNGQFGDSTLPT